ncbi:MAG: tRNA dihydrouridine synthase DusB [Planctomycetales bacterium]
MPHSVALPPREEFDSVAGRFRCPSPAPRSPLRYGPLSLSSRYLLSPLAGYTNLHFRRVVRGLGGVGLATTDLVNARALVAGGEKSFQLIETCPEDSPFAVQIFGSDPEVMCAAARMLEARGVHSIDINMGCPVARITQHGSGASLMCRADHTVELVRRVVESVRVPVTVKMRLGWDETRITAPQFAREFEQAGIAAVAIHGRTRAQGFSGTVDLRGIRQVVEAVESIPVIGNGDVRTVPDAARMLAETGCDGVSIGRAALANPWIFRQLAEWEATGEYGPPGTFQDRLGLLRQQFGHLESRHGTELAIRHFRKMGHWYLKGMRARARLRHEFQQARTRADFDGVLVRIAEEGPTRGTKTGILPEMHVPVPAGPVERW